MVSYGPLQAADTPEFQDVPSQALADLRRFIEKLQPEMPQVRQWDRNIER
jgi:hypothetical protein